MNGKRKKKNRAFPNSPCKSSHGFTPAFGNIHQNTDSIEPGDDQWLGEELVRRSRRRTALAGDSWGLNPLRGHVAVPSVVEHHNYTGML